ncbi:MAG TPA: cytochrome c maturation protein CcmE [Thermohalobaculum sp.]|nr:cytochrome c maturation protein CcmE [Thermohalobaculum sp.]
MATKKTRRIRMMLFGGVLLAVSAVLVSFAFRDAIVFFFSPTELLAEQRRPDQLLRVGGLVVTGTLRRGEGETSTFEITDGNGVVPVSFTGVLPDLFAEGQGVVAEGYLREGTFNATEVLAKHDENYIPKEVVDALKAQGHWEADEAKPDGG